MCDSISNTLGVTCIPQPFPHPEEFVQAITDKKMVGLFRTTWRMDYPNLQNFLEPLYGKGGANEGGSATPVRSRSWRRPGSYRGRGDRQVPGVADNPVGHGAGHPVVVRNGPDGVEQEGAPRLDHHAVRHDRPGQCPRGDHRRRGSEEPTGSPSPSGSPSAIESPLSTSVAVGGDLPSELPIPRCPRGVTIRPTGDRVLEGDFTRD